MGSLMSPDKVKVSVLMGVYNGERYVRQAIESILNQSWRDFEFVIVNDGSTDATAAILASYDDPRLIIVDNETNQGLARSLNIGLKRARGDYIARQDADDMSLPQRLDAQVRFLDAHPQITVVGSSLVEVDLAGIPRGKVTMPKNGLVLRWHGIFQSPICHCAAMFRRATVLEQGAYLLLSEAQDYDLWSRLLWSGHHMANLSEALVQWRSVPEGISVTFSKSQGRNFREIVRTNLRKFAPALGDDARLRDLVWRLQVGGGFDEPLEQVQKALTVLGELVKNFCEYFQLDKRQERRVRQIARRRAARSLLHNAQQYAYAERPTEANQFARLAITLNKRLAFSSGYQKLRVKSLLGQQSTHRLRQAQRRIKSVIHLS